MDARRHLILVFVLPSRVIAANPDSGQVSDSWCLIRSMLSSGFWRKKKGQHHKNGHGILELSWRILANRLVRGFGLTCLLFLHLLTEQAHQGIRRRNKVCTDPSDASNRPYLVASTSPTSCKRRKRQNKKQLLDVSWMDVAGFRYQAMCKPQAHEGKQA